MADKRRKPPRGTGARGRTGPGRPGTGRGQRGPDSTATTPVATAERRRPRLTGRAAILVLVLAVLMVSYASSLRAYLQQRAEITDLNAKIAERQDSIDALSVQKERWNDPEYVKQQAREQFGYVAAGEKSYIVLDADGNRVDGDSSLSDPTSVIKQTPTAWWSTAWESVRLAGDPPRTGKPPAAEIDGSSGPDAPSDQTSSGE